MFDGSKMKAYAGRDLYSANRLKDRIEKIEETLEKFLDNADETDELEDRLEQESNDNDNLKKRIKELEDEKEKFRGDQRTTQGIREIVYISNGS